MTELNLDQFQWFAPKPRNPLAITICNQEQLNLNAKLMEVLPRNFEIGVSEDATQLCIREKPTGYKRLSDGAVKDKRLVQHILDRGVRLPARYAVIKVAGGWIAELEKQGRPVIDMKKPPSKPKTKGMAGVLAELEGV